MNSILFDLSTVRSVGSNEQPQSTIEALKGISQWTHSEKNDIRKAQNFEIKYPVIDVNEKENKEPQPLFIVVMGVAGCGYGTISGITLRAQLYLRFGDRKSTVGTILSNRLNATFFDGDELHSRDNVEKMRSGTPLNDNVIPKLTF
jgi:hypothetical protein